MVSKINFKIKVSVHVLDFKIHGETKKKKKNYMGEETRNITYLDVRNIPDYSVFAT